MIKKLARCMLDLEHRFDEGAGRFEQALLSSRFGPAGEPEIAQFRQPTAAVDGDQSEPVWRCQCSRRSKAALITSSDTQNAMRT